MGSEGADWGLYMTISDLENLRDYVKKLRTKHQDTEFYAELEPMLIILDTVIGDKPKGGGAR